MWFCNATMNTQPLHIDFHMAAKTEFGQPLVNSILTLGLMIGMTVTETTLGQSVRCQKCGYVFTVETNSLVEGSQDTKSLRTEAVGTRHSPASGKTTGDERTKELPAQSYKTPATLPG